MTPRLLITTRTAKTTRNPGNCRPALVVLWAWKTNDSPTTTGSSIATRNSLVKVATLPVSSETLKPAPTTWATSWMVPPRKTPIAA